MDGFSRVGRKCLQWIAAQVPVFSVSAGKKSVGVKEGKEAAACPDSWGFSGWMGFYVPKGFLPVPEKHEKKPHKRQDFSSGEENRMSWQSGPLLWNVRFLGRLPKPVP